jgi:hypothetical protein
MSGPAPTDVSQIEQQAQQLNQASVQGYGVAINPQLATEALLTNGTAPVSYTAALGDPSLQGVISSQPVGDSQFTTKGVPAPSSLYNDPFQFDPNSYQQYVQGMKSNGLNNSFESMGEAPMANLGWMNSILTGDPNTIKKWQTYLSQRGFYGTTSSDGKTFTKGAVNGYSSADFQTGFKNWALAYFLPQAIFSRDPQEQTNANQFLSGIGIDVNSIAQTMSFNPAQRTKVIDEWLQAQGPDGNNIDRLDAFAQHFGSAALPQQLNDLRGDGAFNSIGHFLGHIPGIGNLLGTTPDDLNKKLTPAEQEAMAPALQQAQQNSGFLGFLGDVFSAPSKALVTAGLFFKDGLTGQLGKDNINPFDASSTTSKFVANPMQMMFGQQFTKDHPWLATIGNVVTNVLDDPITFIPFVGEAGLAEKIGEGLDTVGTMSKAEKVALGQSKMTKVEKATGGLVSHRVGTIRASYVRPATVIKAIKNKEAVGTITKALDPIGSAQADVASVLANSKLGVGLVRDILHTYSDDPKVQSKINDLMQLVKTEDSHKILTFLQDPKNGLAHKLFDMSLLTNRNEYHKVISNLDKVDNPNKALHIWNTLALNDAPKIVNGEVPQDAVEAARNVAVTAGIGSEKIAQFEEAFWNANSKDFSRGTVFKSFMDDVQKQLDAKWAKKGGFDGFAKWRDSFKSSTKAESGVAYGMEHDPNKEAVEHSWRTNLPNWTHDIPGGPTAESLNGIVKGQQEHLYELQNEWQSNVTAAARSMQPEGTAITDEMRAQAVQITPQLQNDGRVYQTAMQEIQGEMDKLRSKYSGSMTQTKSAAPVTTTQHYQWFHMPITASEVAAYSNPALKAMNTVQKRLGVDSAMRYWKGLVLSKPSTLARIIIGDETSRFHINLMMNDPATWFSYVKHQATVHGEKLDSIVADMPPQLSNNFYSWLHGVSTHVPMEADDAGYHEGLTHLIENHYAKQQWVKEWQKAVTANKSGDWKAAGAQAIHDFMTGDSEEAANLRAAANVVDIKDLKNNPDLQSLINTKIYDIESLTHYDPSNKDRQQIFNWIKKGTVDKKKLKEMEKTYSKTPDYTLPRIQARPSIMGNGNGGLTQTLDRYHEWAQTHITRARARGYYFRLQSSHKRIQKFYTNPDGTIMGGHSAEDLNKMAVDEATQWTKKNTYQGARSAAGSALRSVAPFWGATANADSFYLRSMIEHPEVAMPILQGTQAISTAEQQPGGLQMNVPGAGWLLSKVGLASGDNFTFDPFNALFLTREGLGGFIPGMGPVFNLGLGALGGVDPSITNAISQLPGMQYVSQGTPMLPWLEEIISGAQQITGTGQGLEAPIIGRAQGYYSKQIDEKLQQLEANWQQGGRKGPAPTIQDAERDYGVGRVVQGAAGFAAPVGLTAQNSVKNEIYTAEQEFTTEMSPAEKQAFYQKYPDVADYFKYIDPATPSSPEPGVESKDQILQKSPWVLAYATGTGQSNIPGKATVADTQAQYKLDVEQGNIQTMDPTSYLTKMRTQEQMAQAWNEFDRLQATYQEWLQSTGVASTSAQATMWKKQNYDPVLQALVNDYPDWGQTFVKSTSTTSQPGLQIASEPFYSVSTFDVLPQNPALETKATILWRAALQRRDQAMSALSQIVSGGGPQIEKDMVLNGLAQQLDSLATQDPTFAAQLSRYRYSSVNDLLQYQANQVVAQAQGFPT